jgi:hypothetical protein
VTSPWTGHRRFRGSAFGSSSVGSLLHREEPEANLLALTMWRDRLPIRETTHLDTCRERGEDDGHDSDETKPAGQLPSDRPLAVFRTSRANQYRGDGLAGRKVNGNCRERAPKPTAASEPPDTEVPTTATSDPPREGWYVPQLIAATQLDRSQQPSVTAIEGMTDL